MSQSSISLVLSVVSIVVAAITLLKGFRDSSLGQKEKDFRARQQYNAEVRRWSSACSDALGESVYLVARGIVNEEMRHKTMSLLSSLVEQGRLFFPNIPPRDSSWSGLDAREGYRPRILDWLVYSLEICSATKAGVDSEAEEILKNMQAGFTGDVQLFLNPRHPFGGMNELTELLGSDSQFMETSQSHPHLERAKKIINKRMSPGIITRPES